MENTKKINVWFDTDTIVWWSLTGAGLKLRCCIPEANNSVTQWRRDADQQRNFSSFKPDPQRPRRKGRTAQTPLNSWCVWCPSVWSCCSYKCNTNHFHWKKKLSSPCCLSCSVIYASIRGPEWKHLCEGNVNHQSGAFRVASSQPRAAAITEYALFKFPLLCQSNDSANKLRILVWVQDLPSKIAHILSNPCVCWNTKRRELFFFFQRNLLLLCCYCLHAFTNVYFPPVAQLPPDNFLNIIFSITGTDSLSPWHHFLLFNDLERFFFFDVACITHPFY